MRYPGLVFETKIFFPSSQEIFPQTDLPPTFRQAQCDQTHNKNQELRTKNKEPGTNLQIKQLTPLLSLMLSQYHQDFFHQLLQNEAVLRRHLEFL